jgi:23S rRNA (guanosine2251-2'-O)-methyltransferase
MRRDRNSARNRDNAERGPSQPAPADHLRSSVFGVQPVLELLRADARKVEKIFIAEGARERRTIQITELAKKRGIIVSRVPRESLARLVDHDANHQGVVAFTASRSYVDIEDIFDQIGSETLLLLLDGIEDPRNLGAILRTAECAGVTGVILPERRAVGLTETVAKASAGAVDYVPVAKVPNLNRSIEELKRRDIWVIGASGEAATGYNDWDWSRPSALVLGNEGSGLHRLVAENCDVLVKVPMYGKIQSLNVSVAAGVILFEARRQRALSSQAAVSDR